MDTSTLEQIGLTKGEIKVYLSLLELGETTTGAIIKKSRITGSKVYEILDKLIKKGLVGYVIREKTKYFQASPPKRILDYVNKKEIELKNRKAEIEKLVPELEQKQKIKEKIQSSYIYEGMEGIKTVLNLILELLKSGEEYYVFTVDEEITSKEVRLLFLNYHTKRIKKRIKARLLSSKRFEKQIRQKYPSYKLSKRRFIDRAFPTGIFIFKDYVATFTFKERPTAFVIKSEQIADSYKEFFESLWEVSKK